MSERFLITGSMGCIGAWTLRHIMKRGHEAVAFDLSTDRQRLDLLMDNNTQESITFVQGDLVDTEFVRAVVADHAITHIVHLAALQVPFCKANPVLGAQVNVVGTTNIFEAALAAGIKHVVYASSVAVYGPPEDYPPGLIAHDALHLPRTLYGVYKVANESAARVYWQDHGITSTTLRPYTVYGVARDQGLTSDPTKAMHAAAQGEDYHIGFGGMMQFHFASDVAQQFIEAALHPLNGAYAFNLGTPPVKVNAVAQIINDLSPNSTITCADNALPFPAGCDPAPLHDHFATVYETPLQAGIQQTIDHFARLTAHA